MSQAAVPAPSAPISDAPEILALDAAVRAALAPGTTFRADAVAEPMAAAIDRLGAHAVDSYLRATGRPGREPLQVVFRKVSQRLRHNLGNRSVHAELLFAPLLFRGEDERRFPHEIDGAIATALVAPLLAELRAQGRDDVAVVPLSSLFTESELDAQTPDFFHRALRTVLAHCSAHGTPPNVLSITGRGAWTDLNCADLQARRPLAERLYEDAARRGPKVSMRLLPLLLIRASDRASPALLAEPNWRVRAGDQLARYAAALPLPPPAAPAVRRVQAALPASGAKPAPAPAAEIAVDILPPEESSRALRAAHIALARDIIGADAAYWLASAVEGSARLTLDVGTGHLRLQYEAANADAAAPEPPLDYAVVLDGGRAGQQAVERLRQDLLLLGFAQVRVTLAGAAAVVPGAAPRAAWQFAPTVDVSSRLQ